MPLFDLEGQPLADPWRTLGDEEPLPASSVALLVSWARLSTAPDAVAGRSAWGVSLPNTVDPHDLFALGLEPPQVIALSFPVFRDGRAYSQARLLRECLGYRGQVRATGALGRDQIPLIRRCGFDALELAADTPWLTAPLPSYPFVYQGAADGAVTIGERRRRQGGQS
ncbi:DUF934 domain-containing protein [Pararhodospirillum photometricum]|uniref:Oxidoreductase probably involved in sulfite reduction n=1 Tax=Pararhodospirillum photometricum DSM 122 TaxID=1150469 RepID=H6SQK1_PARPM|nr:DUF934 domain-containing protein [Pararhodospirillum photometricum]CCG07316.1 Putative uncharacterized protein [Pararhodospirillum photometricum DSM 122]